jgi:hypothetical protein
LVHEGYEDPYNQWIKGAYEALEDPEGLLDAADIVSNKMKKKRLILYMVRVGVRKS